MRKTVLGLILVPILALIILVTLVRCDGYRPPPDGGQPPLKLALPTGTVQQPVGEPAITPTLSGIPAFTKDDVIKYITIHNMLFSDTPGSSITVTNKDVNFITSKEVNTIISRQGLGIPDSYLLCFVTLTGKFTFPAPSTDDGKPVSVTYNNAYEVFDAQTGNLIMGGGLGRAVGTAKS